MLPIIRLGRKKALYYQQPDFEFTRSDKQRLNEINLRDQEYNGFMSPKTRSKVSLFLNTWIDSVEEMRVTLGKGKHFRNSSLTFVTLTLSAVQAHSDNYIKRKMLARFITESKRKFGIHNYFWRAESQKNNNIHFHILIDKYVHWSAIRNLWNHIQADHGYIDTFENVYGHRNPNSTDIRGLQQLKNVGAYLIKYCCKKDGYRKVEGRIWGASDSIKLLRPLELVVDSELQDVLHKFDCNKEIKKFKVPEFVSFSCNIGYQLSKINPVIYNKYKNHYLRIYEELYIKKKVSEPIVLSTRKENKIIDITEIIEKKHDYVVMKKEILNDQYLLLF